MLDKDGMATRDPRVMFPEDGQQGGALTPAGLHKGGGLAVMCEIFGGVLSGGQTISPHHHRYRKNEGMILNSMLTIIIDTTRVSQIGSVDVGIELERLKDYVCASPSHGGVKFPGEVEQEIFKRRNEVGIPLSEGVAMALRETARNLDVEYPFE